VSRFPVAFRLPAFASLVILSPLRSWTFLAVGLPDNARTPSGFHVPHPRVTTGKGALSTPRTAVLTRPIASLRPPPAASQRECPYTPAEHPSSGAQLDEASLRVHCIHPSGLPLACVPRMERAPLGFSPELRTLPLPATHVRVGTGIEHLPGPTQSTSSVDPPSHESTRIVRPRVAPRDSYLPMKQALRGRARRRKVTRLGDISGQPLDLSSRRDRRP
jgi:hypothetical protein